MTLPTSCLAPKLPPMQPIVEDKLKPIPECLCCLARFEPCTKYGHGNLTIDDPRKMFGCMLSAHKQQLNEHYAKAIHELAWFFQYNCFTDHLYVFEPLLKFAVNNEEPKLLWLTIMAACKFSDHAQEPIEDRFPLKIRFAARELFNLGIECKRRDLYFSNSPLGWRLNLTGISSVDDGFFKLLHNIDQIQPIRELDLFYRPDHPWTPEHIEQLFGALSGPESVKLDGINIFPIQNGSLTVPEHWKKSLKELQYSNVGFTGALQISIPGLTIFIQDSPNLQSITAPEADSVTYFQSYWWTQPGSQLVAVRAQKATSVRVHGAKLIKELHAPEAIRIDLEGDHSLSSIVALKCHKLCIPVFTTMKWQIHPEGKCIRFN